MPKCKTCKYWKMLYVHKNIRYGRCTSEDVIDRLVFEHSGYENSISFEPRETFHCINYKSLWENTK